MSPTGPHAVIGRVFANRDLRRVLVAYLAFNIAEFGTWIAVLLYAYEQAGPTSVGVVALIQLVPAALIAAPAASLGDRFPRERVLAGGYVGQSLAMLATAAAMFAAAPVWLVVAAAATAASALVVTRPTQSALLPSLSRTPDQLTAANAAAGIVEGAGLLIGPLLAAALVQAHIGIVFLLAGAGLAVAALVTLGLRPDRALADDTVGDSDSGLAPHWATDRSFWAGLGAIVADKDARLVVGLLTARMVVIGAADVLFVLMALDLLGMGEPGAGILNAALGAGAIAGSTITFVLVGRRGLAYLAALGAATWAVSLGLIGITAEASIAPVLVIVGGAGLAVVDIAGRSILQRSIHDEVLGRVFGLQESLAMAGLAVGSILVAAIVGIVDLLGAIAVVAALLPIIVALIWSRLSALDRRSVVPVQALALIRRTQIFGPLSPPQLEAIARRAVWLTQPSGTVLIREGDQGDRYYVLASGIVRVEQGGRELRRLDRAGDGFGEIALLRDVPRTATAIAVTEVAVLAIDRAPFLAAVTGHPASMRAAQEVVAKAGR
ncbi:MAG: cyclic nucleotide-binding domain-containing protein [Candidatus Limnocylindrales bacterium]